MIIWEGLGLLGLIFQAISFMLIDLIFSTIFDNLYVSGGKPYFIIVNAIISGAICFYIGRWMNNREIKNAKIYYDPETEKQVALVKKHTIFYIKMEYIAIIISCITIFSVIKHSF